MLEDPMRGTSPLPLPATEPQISFLKLTVADLEASQAFYENAFGMIAGTPIAQGKLTELVMKSPDNPFALTLLQYAKARPVESVSASNSAAAFYIGFYVTDMVAGIARAQAAGAKLLRGPDYFEQVSYAFLETPDGHVIELIDRGNGR
ncbi:MAG: VOC family protein [Sphingomonadaceae bacterium]|nr:VOC family protein [Sphingomonadaceae bacterium]